MDASVMADYLVEVEEVWRSFQRGRRVVPAVQGCSFRVGAGEAIAIVGSSGSGKTTLLNLVAGLDRPSAGRIVWPALGPIETLRPARIGIVFQSPNLLPALTSLENVALPIRLSGESDAEARAMTVLSAFGVEHLAHKLPEQISGGQAECVAVARALAAGPQLILADEPTGQLDRANSVLLIDRLLSWLSHSRGALVLATHDNSVAARIGRIWRMDHGRLEARMAVA